MEGLECPPRKHLDSLWQRLAPKSNLSQAPLRISSQLGLNLGLPGLSLQSLVLARALLRQCKREPSPRISHHPRYLSTNILIPWLSGLPSGRILLGQFSKNCPHPIRPLWVTVHTPTPHPAPLVFAFRVEPDFSPLLEQCWHQWQSLPYYVYHCHSNFLLTQPEDTGETVKGLGLCRLGSLTSVQRNPH